MAENEVLDVANPRRYRRFLRALADPNLGPIEVGNCLVQDFWRTLRSKLRGAPLKEREMAKHVERARTITKSSDPLVVAGKIAELLTDGLVDQLRRHAAQHDHNANSARHAALEYEASARLAACKTDIVKVLAASLSGEPMPRARRAAKPKASARSVLGRSLRVPDARQPDGSAGV